MGFESVVLATMLTLSAWKHDRGMTDDERSAMLLPIAEEIASFSEEQKFFSRTGMVSSLIAVAYVESTLAKYVIEARCGDGPPGMRCDEGKARGIFQLRQVACPTAWEFPDGSRESLREEVRCAARRLAHGYSFCKRQGFQDPWVGTYAVYRGPLMCEDPKGERFARLRSKIQQHLQTTERKKG